MTNRGCPSVGHRREVPPRGLTFEGAGLNGFTMTIEEIEKDLVRAGHEPTTNARAIATVLHQMLFGAAGEQAKPVVHLLFNCPRQPVAGDRMTIFEAETTCPDCLKLMHGGTGKEQQPPDGPAKHIREAWDKFAEKRMPELREVLFQAFLRGARAGQANPKEPQPSAPPAAPKPGKSRGEEVAEKRVWVKSGQILFQIREQGEVRYLNSWKGQWSAEELCSDLRAGLTWIIDDAAGEARRKALEEVLEAGRKIINKGGVFSMGELNVMLRAMQAIPQHLLDLDAAAAPAGEGSKT